MLGSDPAYPIPGQSTGITMRDWFAGMALVTVASTAQEAYDFADTMLEQREIKRIIYGKHNYANR